MLGHQDNEDGMVCLGFFPLWPLHLTAGFPGNGPYTRILIHNLFRNEFLKRALACRQMPIWTVLKLKSTTGNTTFLERSPSNYPAAIYENKSQLSHATTDLKARTGARTHLHTLSLSPKWTDCLLMTQKICQHALVYPVCYLWRRSGQFPK